MKKYFNIEDYTNQKAVMLCKTKRQCKKFQQYLDKQGRTWRTGASYLTKTPAEEYDHNAIYYFF